MMRTFLSGIIAICMVPLLHSDTTCIKKSGEELVNKLAMPDSSLKKIKQERTEVFKQMGWEEGKFRNAKEKTISQKLHKELIYYHGALEVGQFDSNFFRPFVEYAYNSQESVKDRCFTIRNFRYLGGKKTLPILKKLLNNENEKIQNTAAQELYNAGEKDLVLQKYLLMIKNGHYISCNNFIKYDTTTGAIDSFPKKYLEEIVTCVNNPSMQILAAAYLYGLGEKEKANIVYQKIKIKCHSLQNDTIANSVRCYDETVKKISRKGKYEKQK